MPEPTAPALPLGRLESAVAKLFTKPACVRALEDVADGFRRVTFAGEALRGVSWTPGQKIQLMLGGWVQRTYTPLCWDAASGVTQLLAFSHGDGPGATWARSLEVGARSALFGPRGSLDLSRLERPALLFGDETSIGLAHALRFTSAGAQEVHVLLEVSSKAASSTALEALGVSGTLLYERRADDTHLAELLDVVRRLQRERALQGAVLSGKATSIQRLNRELRQLGLPRSQIQSKAYWAPGKTGLD